MTNEKRFLMYSAGLEPKIARCPDGSVFLITDSDLFIPPAGQPPIEARRELAAMLRKSAKDNLACPCGQRNCVASKLHRELTAAAEKIEHEAPPNGFCWAVVFWPEGAYVLAVKAVKLPLAAAMMPKGGSA